MFVPIWCVILLLIIIVQCDKGTDYCKDGWYRAPRANEKKFIKLNMTSQPDIDQLHESCKKFTCLTKCCPINYVHYTSTDRDDPNCRKLDYVKSRTNGQLNSNFDYSDLQFYQFKADNFIETKRSLKNGKYLSIFNLKFFKKPDECTSGLFQPGQTPSTTRYLLENGELVTAILPHRYVRFPKVGYDKFCYEYLVEHWPELNRTEVYIHYLTFESKSNSRDLMDYQIAAFVISSFFLLLFLFVYSSLPELRRLAGMIQMAYCTTYTMLLILETALLLAYNKLLSNGDCLYLAPVIYYLILSSFFWINIMSFDIWWTFRGYYKQRAIHRRGELVKFGWYALYAWGAPLLITIIVTVIDNVDVPPHVLKPFFQKNCLRFTREMNFFQSLPIGILLAANCLFFALTSYNYWRVKQNLSQIQNSSSGKSSKTRFLMYFKLSVIMGIGWIFDVTNDYLPIFLQYIAYGYNGLIGVTIFFIFIFKKNMMIKICHRYGLHHRFEFLGSLERKWSSTVTRRTEISSNPHAEGEPTTHTIT